MLYNNHKINFTLITIIDKLRYVLSGFSRKQAGAELCPAQVQLGLAMLAVTRKKLMAYLLQILDHIPYEKKCR